MVGLALLWSWMGAGAVLAAGAKQKNNKEFRSWVVPDPLYEELLGTQPPPLGPEGSIIWQHVIDVPVGRMTAIRFAVRWVSDELHEQHSLGKFHALAIAPNRLDDREAADRWKVTTICVPEFSGFPWVMDPGATQAYLDEAESLFSMDRVDKMWGLDAGDEMADVAVRQGAELAENPGGYGYIVTADAEVKQDYGGGIYGIPAGIKEKDPNPYKWIAFRRWVNAKLLQRHQNLRTIVEANNPKLYISGTHPPGIAFGLHAREFSSHALPFDIATHQIGYPGVGNGPGGVNPWRNTVGLITKVLTDLTGKETWPVIHIGHTNYPDATPAEVIEEFSQVFRNGGTGIHLFLQDIMGYGKLVGDTRTPYFGSPRRWHTIVNIAQHKLTMPALKFPRYDRTAVLYNDDTLAATPYDAIRPYSGHIEACYMMLGPVARSWFKFIDSDQVMNRAALIDKFDIIYVPTAKYQRPAIVTKLRNFVEAGGTLVCGDPGAFGTDLLGNDTVASRKEMFGVTVGRKLGVKRLVPKSAGLGEKLALRGDAYKLTPVSKVEVLAAYEDGSPAITANAVGKGRAILFGANPFLMDSVPDSAWRDFFTAWAAAMGAPTGLDIWRFKLPDSLIWQESPQPGVCLTNNRVLWQEEQPLVTQNLDMKGSYRYSPPPDAMPDVTTADWTPFSQGRLTDRRKSMLAEKVERRFDSNFVLPASHWMVGWAMPDPVSITFDLKQPRPLLQFKLWFNDTMPAVTVEGSTYGRQWRPLGKAVGQEAGPDTYDMVIFLNKELPSRYLRATFAARRPGQKLSIVEAEVWAEKE